MHKQINMKWNLCVMGGVDLLVERGGLPGLQQGIRKVPHGCDKVV